MDRLTPDLRITDHRDGARTVIEVSGEIDIFTAPALRDRLEAILHDGYDTLVIDLDGVEFMDSTGLGVLVAIRQQLLPLAGQLDLICHQERILKLFRVTGMDRIFTISS